MADQMLLAKVAEQLAKGTSDEQIKENLAKSGWSAADINGAIAIQKIQKGSFSMQSHLPVPPPVRSHTGTTILQFVMILILLAAAPGAYGLMTAYVVPTLAGKAASISDALIGYSLLKDVPADSTALLQKPSIIGAPDGLIPGFVTVAVNHVSTGGEAENTGGAAPAAGAAPSGSTESSVPAPNAPFSVSFTADPSDVMTGGQTLLTWDAPGAVSCDGNVFSANSKTNGSARVTVYSPKTYTITCRDVQRDIVTQSLTITPGGQASSPPDTSTDTDTSTSVVTTTDVPDPTIPVLPPSDPIPPTPIGPLPSSTPPIIPGTPTVSNTAQLMTALAAAQGGDTITLAAGNYGDVTINKMTFPSDVTLTSFDSSNPATFRSILVENSSHIAFNNIYVHYTPTTTSVDWNSEFSIKNDTSVTLQNSVMHGEPAISGGDPNGSTDDPSGNVIGYPTGYGISIDPTSTNILIQNNDMSGMDRGIVMGAGANFITLRGNNIHNTRRTAIAGGASNLIIDGNYLHDVYPWALGHTPWGDHADNLALWNDATHPITNVQIINNRMEKGNGASTLGMWFQGYSSTSNFSHSVIRNNVFIIDNLQAIVLWNTSDTIVDHNVMLHTPADVGPDDWKRSPIILLEASVQRMTITNNIMYAFSDKSTTVNTGADATVHSGNIYDQQEDSTKPGYYDQTLVQQAESMSDPTAIYNLVQSSLKNPVSISLNTFKTNTLLAAAASALGSLTAFLKHLLAF